LLATGETIGQFFNGQDLALWTAFGGEWSVINGEIHGRRTDQPSVADRLLSDLLLDDFLLDMEVRLTGQKGAARILLVPWLGRSETKPASLPEEPQIVWLDLRHDEDGTDERAANAIREPSSDEGPPKWRAVRIHRTTEVLKILVDGAQVLSETIDATTRLRLVLSLRGDADGELIVRSVTLSVESGAASATDHTERSPSGGDQ
jgi:hypothetical protein